MATSTEDAWTRIKDAVQQNTEVSSLANQVLEAYIRIRPAALHTPMHKSPWLAEHTGAGCVWLKMESEQHSGAFKLRGALNKVMSLTPDQALKPLITSSTGNHALAVLYAINCMRHTQTQGQIQTDNSFWPAPRVFVPQTISKYKLSRLNQQGADVMLVGNDCVDSELAAAAEANRLGFVYVSPYNDLQVMAGQGTTSVEVLLDLSVGGCGLPDVVFIPVGGGGLIAGMAALLKAAHPRVHVVGCQPSASYVMAASVKAGRIVEMESKPTLSDATAGGIEPDALTLEPCIRFVDEWVLVDELEIRDAMRSVIENHSKLIEGAAGCAVAACLKVGRAGGLVGKTAVVLICGGNVSVTTLQQVLADDPPTSRT